MKYALALVVAFALTGAAVAQHNHEAQKGPNGGMMDDVAGVHAELVTSGTAITINIFDGAVKPLATKGFTASVLVVRGSEREPVILTPTAENVLKGDAKKPIGPGAAITVTLKTAAGRFGQVKFKL